MAPQDVSEGHDSEPITAETPPVSPPTVIEGDRSGVGYLGTVARPLDLDAIEKRANDATPGPWAVDDGWAAPGWEPGVTYTRIVTGEANPISGIRHPVLSTDGSFAGSDHKAESLAVAEFVAHAREDVPALVAAIRTALALHPKVNVPTSGSTDPKHIPTSRSLCGLCRDPWPCSTVKALS